MLRRALLGAMKKLKLADRSIEIALVPTAVMKKNVLSFAYPATFPQTAKIKTIGDLYLNPDYIRAHGENLEHMAIHGLLHLVGYGHRTKRAARRMEALEKRLLAAN